jgi:hypothetical protein
MTYPSLAYYINTSCKKKCDQAMILSIQYNKYDHLIIHTKTTSLFTK